MRPTRLALGFLLAASCPLHAWDRENHVAIVQAALVLSPAAAARIPAGFRSALMEEAEEPDASDRSCTYHRGGEASVHPAVEAEKIFRALGAPALSPSAYQRSRSLGRLLHYVADCAVPTPIAQGGSATIPNYWGNRDWVLFRERRPLAFPLAASLRERGAAAQWADESPVSNLSAFRLAVNLTVEALLLLPPAAGAAEAPDSGPVGFVVNRIDNGRSGTKSSYWYVVETTRVGNNYFHEDYIAESRSGGQGARQADLMSRKGLQLVEWVQRTDGPAEEVQAVLFNNGPSPACAVTFSGPRWTKTLELTVQADTLERVTFPAPAGTRAENVKVSYVQSGCPPGAASRTAIPAFPRVIVGAFSAPPRFEAGETAPKTASLAPREAPQPRALGSTVDIRSDRKSAFAGRTDNSLVTWDASVERSLTGLLAISSIRVRRQGTGWTFRAAVRNTGQRPLGPVTFQVRVKGENAAAPPAVWKLAFELNGLAAGGSGEFDAFVAGDGSIQPASFELLEVSAASKDPVRPAPAAAPGRSAS